jgi:hypothetical protein
VRYEVKAFGNYVYSKLVFAWHGAALLSFFLSDYILSFPPDPKLIMFFGVL